MKPIIIKSILIFIIVAVAIVIIPTWIIHLYNSSFQSGAKTLILPEEICQVERGDHLQLYQSHDTIYLEYTFQNRKPIPPIRGVQVTVGGDQNFGEFKDSMIGVNIDTLIKVWNLTKSVDSNLEKGAKP